jgi:3-keto steroid reductase
MLNAGGGPFIGLHWGATLYRISTRFLYAVTHPDYLVERTGLMTNDKLGWTWQCNVFGHFLMVRGLVELLSEIQGLPGQASA